MSGAVDLPAFDRTAVEGHVSLLHVLAEGLDGVLILAAFMPNGGGKPQVQRFRIGDVAGMVETIMGFENHRNLNLYAPWSVFRRDLEPGKKGSEADVVAVLAAVGDLDNDKYTIGELPVEAPYIIETSPGNFQPVYIFERPLAAADAKPVLAALCDFVGGDSATKDTSHVWRIPGCLNWPTKSKLARGRPPVPVLATIKKGYDGGFTSPAALLALAPPPRLPNGHDTKLGGSLSFAEEARLRGALAVIPAEDRDTWLKVGAALQLFGARAVWDDWSKTSGKFDAADQDRVWASFHGERKEGVITVATIYGWAKERGWQAQPFFEDRAGAQRDGQLPAPNPIKLLSYAEMTALPEGEFLIRGVIVRRAKNVLFGLSNAFKSFMATDMGGSVATGRSYHGNAVKKCPVIYVANEGAIAIGRKRIPAWMAAHEIPQSERANIYLVNVETILPNEISRNNLLAAIRSIVEPGEDFFLIIDVLRGTMTGSDRDDVARRDLT